MQEHHTFPAELTYIRAADQGCDDANEQ